MAQAHIAVFTAPHKGHIYPVLGLATELVKRGHRVTFVTSNNYAERVRDIGAEPVCVKFPTLHGADNLIDLCNHPEPGWWEMCAGVIYPLILLDAAVTVGEVERFYQNENPNLVLYDRIAFAGRILSSRWGCPAVQLYPHFAFYEKHLFRDASVSCNPTPILHFARVLDSFLFGYGIDSDDNMWHTERLNIYFVPKEFQYNADSFDNRSRFVGPCLKRPYTPLWHNRSRGKPIILVSDLSTASDGEYFEILKAALSGQGYHVILSIGEDMREDRLRALPEDFEINRQASHLEILPHASLLICHGGMGSTLEAIYHGVPVVAVPPTPFNEEIAYRLTELEIGVRLKREGMDVKVVRERIDAIMRDQRLRSSVKEMQRKLSGPDGSIVGADAIEEFIRHGQ